MSSIPKQFDWDGFRHEQIERSEHAAIYKRTSLKTGSFHFETVLILTERKTRKLPSGSIRKAGSERYPASSEWGIYGWTPNNIEDARKKFHELNKKGARNEDS